MKGYRVPDPPPVDPVAARVDAILADAELEREESESSKVDELEKFYQECGWDPVRNYLMSILEDPARSVDDWTTIAAVFWGAVLDRLPVSTDRLIALLYKRLPPDSGSSENNLAWSITSKLKAKSYMSRYDPLDDPGVRRELESLERS
jgi:hypothetical protein